MEKVWGPKSWQINWQRQELTDEQFLTKLREAIAAGAADEVEEILLNSNKLTKLPFDELSKFKKLSNLSANDNALTDAGVAGLSQLSETLSILQLGSNHLTELPVGISHLTNLTTIALHCNKIHAVSDEITRLNKLKFLNLGSNAITHLPKDIGLMSNLDSLFVHENQLSALPASMKNLARLENMSFNDNPNLAPKYAKRIDCDKQSVKEFLKEI